MTKAEIIEYLYDNHVRADITLEEMADDLSVEPSAQPYVPDTNVGNTDTISRADAIKAFCERCGNLGEPCDGCNDIPLLYSLPSAQPEWEEFLVICDNCGHAIRVKRH